MRNVLQAIHEYVAGQVDYHPSMLYAVAVDAPASTTVQEYYDDVDILGGYAPVNPLAAVTTNTYEDLGQEYYLTRRYEFGPVNVVVPSGSPPSGKVRRIALVDAADSNARVLASVVQGSATRCVDLTLTVSGSIWATDLVAGRTLLSGIWDHVLGVASYPITAMYAQVRYGESVDLDGVRHGYPQTLIASDAVNATSAFAWDWTLGGLVQTGDITLPITTTGQTQVALALSADSTGDAWYTTLGGRYRDSSDPQSLHLQTSEDYSVYYGPTSSDSAYVRLGNIWRPYTLS